MQTRLPRDLAPGPSRLAPGTDAGGQAGWRRCVRAPARASRGVVSRGRLILAKSRERLIHCATAAELNSRDGRTPSAKRSISMSVGVHGQML